MQADTPEPARVSKRNVLTGEGRVESLRVAEITASAFPLARVPPLLGRPLQPTDEMQGAAPVVVLGYDVWQRQFLQDPAIIGRVVTVGRTARTVVGVMPAFTKYAVPTSELFTDTLAPAVMLPVVVSVGVGAVASTVTVLADAADTLPALSTVYSL